MKNIFSGLLVVVAMALTGCRSALPLAGPPPDAWYIPKIKVALYLDVGCKGGGVIHWAELLKSSPDVACTFINAADVQAGKLVGYDVLVMPGGSGYDRYAQLGEEGFEKIRKYIREGGKYYGVCAGIALALNDPEAAPPHPLHAREESGARRVLGSGEAERARRGAAGRAGGYALLPLPRRPAAREGRSRAGLGVRGARDVRQPRDAEGQVRHADVRHAGHDLRPLRQGQGACDRHAPRILPLHARCAGGGLQAARGKACHVHVSEEIGPSPAGGLLCWRDRPDGRHAQDGRGGAGARGASGRGRDVRLGRTDRGRRARPCRRAAHPGRAAEGHVARGASADRAV
ncbi:MAG: hypothetical protein IJI36_05650 [Kiritimatiellae bacterium]|nr:hypothetical protein [Kiritimatiellia bacterium]